MTMQNNYLLNNSPLVSIIMPVHNAERYLSGTLRSILEQKYANIELICIIDLSIDNSLAILKNIASYDQRVVIIEKNQKLGPAKARNLGLDRAQGKYLSFVDADDRVDVDIYQKLVFCAEENNADVVIFGGTPFPDENNAPQWIKEKLSPRNVIYQGEDAGKTALFYEKSSRPFLWLHFIKRELIEYPFSLRLPENLDLGEDQVFQFCYLPRAKNVVCISEKLYFYRYDNVGSIMWRYNRKKSEKFNKHLKIVESVFAKWQEYQYGDKYGNLISWAVEFLYGLLSTFPQFLRQDYADKFLQIVDKYPYKLFMCNEQVVDYAFEIKKWSSNKVDFGASLNYEVDKYRQQIEEKERVIKSLLSSKSFKIGRLLTPLNKRSSISDFLPAPIDKD